MIPRLIALCAVAVLSLAGCGSVPELGPSAAAVPESESVQEELQFTAKTLDGEDFSGQNLLGKPAVLWFWAPWCPVCQREAPMVGAVEQANPAVAFIGVAAQDEASAMQDFVDTHPVKGFTHLADTDGAVWARFGITYQPAYAFIEPDGGVEVIKSSLSQAELSRRVTELSER